MVFGRKQFIFFALLSVTVFQAAYAQENKLKFTPLYQRARISEIRECHQKKQGDSWKDCRWSCSELCSDIPESFAHGICSGIIGQLCCKQHPTGKDSHRCQEESPRVNESDKYIPRYVKARLPEVRRCFKENHGNTWKQCKYNCIEICNEINEDYFRGVCQGTLIDLCCDQYPATPGDDALKCRISS